MNRREIFYMLLIIGTAAVATAGIFLAFVVLDWHFHF
jgi:hypothetical protein